MVSMFILFTLCGNPEYIVAYDNDGPMVGYAQTTPTEMHERLVDITISNGAVLITKSLDQLVGVRCS